MKPKRHSFVFFATTALAALLSAHGVSAFPVRPLPSFDVYKYHVNGHVVQEEDPPAKAKPGGPLFLVSPKTHATSTALFFALFGLLSFEPVGKLAHSVLFKLPCASWDPIEFHPLGALNWAVHAVLLVFALELPGSFFTLMSKSDDAREKRAYRGFFLAYSLAYAHSIMTTMSHAFIRSNEPLERVLHNMFAGLLRTFIFGTGLSVKLGPWALLPVFVGVNHGALGYSTWAGRGLATYTIYKHLASKELPSTFKYFFVAFNVAPAMIGKVWQALTKELFGDTVPELLVMKGKIQSDAAHLLVAVVIAAISGGMALSLNRKVCASDDVMGGRESWGDTVCVSTPR